MTVLQSLISPWKRKGKRRKEKLLQRKVFYGGLEGTSTYFFFIRDFFFFIRDCFFRPRLFSFCLRLFFYPRLLFLPRVLRLRAHIHWRAGLRSRTGNMAVEGFTVADAILVVGQTRQNVQWMYGKNRDFDARYLEEGWYSEISVNCKLKILAKRARRLNLKGIGLLNSEKSSF